MTCIQPKIATWNYYKKVNEKTGEIYNTKELHFKNQYTFDDDILKDKYMLIPCQKCKGCQIDKSNSWATRAYLESLRWPFNCFITLTYNNENLPKNRSLQKRDIQLFWKRLRKALPEKIRYMCCGEMGPRTLRPHYHACVFNYWPTDAKPYKQNDSGNTLYTSESLTKIWGKGFVIVGNLTYESAAYVARYVMKKAYGIDKDYYKKHKREPEFILTSRKPGIAATILNTKLWESIKKNNCVFIPTKNGMKTTKIPQFLKNKWKDTENREEYFQKQDERARALKQNTRARLKNTTLNYWQYSKLLKELQDERLKRLDKRNEL